MIDIAGFIREQTGPARDLDLSITIHFEFEEECDIARSEEERPTRPVGCAGDRAGVGPAAAG